MKAKEHQQQLHLMQQRNVHLQRRDPNHPPLSGSVNADGMMGKPSASSTFGGIDNLRPNMGLQAQKPNMQNQNQFYLALQQQEGNLGASPNYGLVGLPRGSQSMKDGQTTRNDGSVGSPCQMNSPKMKMPQMQQSTSQQQDQPQQQDDIKHFGDVSLDDNVESFLQHDGGEVYGSMKQTLTQHKTESSKGFSFGEVGCIRTRKKVLCCHFSSDGKLLASAGHDKKVVLWNMDTLETETTPEEHQFLITDVRFRPNSTQFGTTFLDQSVRIWDAANPSYCVHAHTGHTSHVMSLDFHPKKTDLFCFCDSNNGIQYWNMNPFQCTRVSKPGSGKLLASASDKIVSIFDVETDRQTHSLQAHMGVVNYLCWDMNGEYLASVSDDIVRVWSVASGECIHELSSGENQFYSCAFHPSYSALLVIGGLRSLELWNMAENKSMTVSAHDNIIAALAQSAVTGMVASASHDSSVNHDSFKKLMGTSTTVYGGKTHAPLFGIYERPNICP
ncbi:hypothetical protein L2E82_20238 [Cichorium intybus]|uniref:Uncharacterized protein n=1 Tax=Cichorium intybus TaxID=13427 RepID=A0ACB9DSG2_CICIN|nr:hypothetical protein L2E82_20238 [Cichorium intybus]